LTVPPSPEVLVLVCGTGTEVGKTWSTCRMVEDLGAAGLRIEARKPLQSHDPADTDPLDAELLAAATGEEPAAVCPPDRTYPLAMAPAMAAEALDRPCPTTAALAASLRWGQGVGVGLVETAGGARSPLAADGDNVDLVRALDPHLVVLVADAGLGTLNAVRAAAAALVDWPLVVLLNRFDPGSDLHRRNRDWLSDRYGLSVLVDAGAVADRIRSLVAAGPDGGADRTKTRAVSTHAGGTL
jgi:dethiobiotin synthetase